LGVASSNNEQKQYECSEGGGGGGEEWVPEKASVKRLPFEDGKVCCTTRKKASFKRKKSGRTKKPLAMKPDNISIEQGLGVPRTAKGEGEG